MAETSKSYRLGLLPMRRRLHKNSDNGGFTCAAPKAWGKALSSTSGEGVGKAPSSTSAKGVEKALSSTSAEGAEYESQGQAPSGARCVAPG